MESILCFTLYLTFLHLIYFASLDFSVCPSIPIRELEPLTRVVLTMYDQNTHALSIRHKVDWKKYIEILKAFIDSSRSVV